MNIKANKELQILESLVKEKEKIEKFHNYSNSFTLLTERESNKLKSMISELQLLVDKYDNWDKELEIILGKCKESKEISTKYSGKIKYI